MAVSKHFYGFCCASFAAASGGTIFITKEVGFSPGPNGPGTLFLNCSLHNLAVSHVLSAL
jgi:hypothetical protein